MRRFTVNEPGPSPKFRGIMALGSRPVASHHDVVRLSCAHFAPNSANVGRSVNKASPFRSTPLTMLNGLPDDAITNGLREISHGRLILPPIVNIFLISNDDLPYSPVRS